MQYLKNKAQTVHAQQVATPIQRPSFLMQQRETAQHRVGKYTQGLKK